jgi:hypothetical protein
MGGNFANYTPDKGLITRIYREFKKLNSERINNPTNKWANKLNRVTKEVQTASKSLAVKKCKSK